jgi:hypothetical protein
MLKNIIKGITCLILQAVLDSDYYYVESKNVEEPR